MLNAHSKSLSNRIFSLPPSSELRVPLSSHIEMIFAKYVQWLMTANCALLN
jgi:hypothetical protein